MQRADCKARPWAESVKRKGAGTGSGLVDWMCVYVCMCVCVCVEFFAESNNGFQQITSLISCCEYILVDRSICNMK